MPLDYNAAAVATPPLKIGVSDLDAREGRVISGFASGGELREYLRAGAWIPILAGGPVTVGGTRYVDGGVFFANPMYVAARDGCTHILSLGTRPQGSVAKHPSLADRILTSKLDRWSPGAAGVYLESLRVFEEQRHALGFGETTFDGVRLFRLAVPAGGHDVSRLTMERATLLDGARAGYVAAMAQLGGRAIGSPPFCLDFEVPSTAPEE